MEIQGTFRIAEPCHENWNSMSAETQGRFCASCQRCVIDFTQKSPTEMKAIYEQENGDVCGRVRVSQVAKPRTALRGTIERYRMRGLKAIQMFALALLTAFSFMVHSGAQAQKPMIMGKMAYVPERVGEADLAGRVVDAEGHALKGAEVWILQEGNEVAMTKTDAKGTYTFQKMQAGEYEIMASSGHSNGSIVVDHGSRAEKVADIVVAEMRMMGQMIFVPDDLEKLEISDPGEITPIEKLAILDRVDEGTVTEKLAILDTVNELTPIAPIWPLLEDVDQPELETLPSLTNAKLLTDAPIDLAGTSIRAFPNPTTDRVTLILEQGAFEHLDLILYDIHGKEMYSGTWLPAKELTHTIEMQALPNGIYILRLQAGEQAIHRQLLKL